MEIEAILGSIDHVLQPVLPHLLRVGEKAVDEFGAGLASDARQLVKGLWTRLTARSAQSASMAAAREASSSGEDDKARELLMRELSFLLVSDKKFRKEVENIITAMGTPQFTVQGRRNIIINGNVHRARLSTGDIWKP